MNDYQAASFLNDDDDFESEQEEFAPTPSPREAALLGDDAVRRVVAQFVNITRWPSCDCPSGQPHKSVRVLFKNGLPYVHCFHPSCVADRATVNAQIADAFRALSPEKKKICRTPETAEERLLLRQAEAAGVPVAGQERQEGVRHPAPDAARGRPQAVGAHAGQPGDAHEFDVLLPGLQEGLSGREAFN